jgi:hypothetical protein
MSFAPDGGSDVRVLPWKVSIMEQKWTRAHLERASEAGIDCRIDSTQQNYHLLIQKALKGFKI